ncbi:MAG TPA: sigma-70 family RNA polymerase sigma factor [Candidatus Limnocylindrales bacterium]|nr:sigma-70 family RNA polymerase sigma factor [Candidatus Limnocylindrales bacterium]
MPEPSASGLHDRRIVDAVLAGDRDSFRALVERESATVIAVCMSVLRDREEALDVAQDAFVQAYRALATYRGDGTFGAWIARIASRLAVARASTTARRPVTTTDDINAYDVADVSGDGFDLERTVLGEERAAALRDAIERLPADQREVVNLRFFRDMPLEQIALETASPLGTVKSRLHRALQRLREQADLGSAS